VCGYSKLERPPADFTICPSCGTEFELDDEICSHEELRRVWLRCGAPWFSETEHPPHGWQKYRAEQLFTFAQEMTDSVEDVVLVGSQRMSVELS
jgi:hypothetical protein